MIKSRKYTILNGTTVRLSCFRSNFLCFKKILYIFHLHAIFKNCKIWVNKINQNVFRGAGWFFSFSSFPYFTSIKSTKRKLNYNCFKCQGNPRINYSKVLNRSSHFRFCFISLFFFCVWENYILLHWENIFLTFCRIQNFCGSMADSVTSDNNILHIRYFAEAAAIDSAFEILYTAFRDKSTTPGGNGRIFNSFETFDSFLSYLFSYLCWWRVRLWRQYLYFRHTKMQ